MAGSRPTFYKLLWLQASHDVHASQLDGLEDRLVSQELRGANELVHITLCACLPASAQHVPVSTLLTCIACSSQLKVNNDCTGVQQAAVG